MAAPRILIIDDDINILSTLRILFQREQFVVQTAFDGEDGLKKVLSGGCDLILSDVDMPKMNGFEVFQKLKQQGMVQQVPIIMMSRPHPRPSPPLLTPCWEPAPTTRRGTRYGSTSKPGICASTR